MKFRKSNYKYQLAEDETHVLPFDTGVYVDHDWIVIAGNVLIGKKGYAWNGCSGPTWDDKTNYRGSLYHDMGYQLIGAGILPYEFKALFDAEFKRVCIEDGMWKFRAEYYFAGVSLFGRGPAMTPEPEIIEV